MTSEFCVAVHALVFLNHKATTVSSESLAENICTNPARIRKIMAKLKKGGLVTTKEGVDGGYRFELNPKEVSLYDVGEALETVFIGSTWRSGDTDMECLVSSGMAYIMDGIYQDLDALCKERLKSTTIQTLENRIFGRALSKSS